jgi:virginiamycin A acetyltransferase
MSLKNRISTYLKLNFSYKKLRKKGSRIESIVPDELLKSFNTIVEQNVVFHNWNSLQSFGNHNFIGNGAYFDHCSSIGSFCSISADVKIGLRNHNLKAISTSPNLYLKSRGFVDQDELPVSSPTIIENDVLISGSAIVLEGVTLGTGCVVAAGAVVNKDVPPYAIVGGVPAKVLKYRFDEEQIEFLLQSKWWMKSKEEIKIINDSFKTLLK